jgi:hypothetical protein
MKPGLSKSGPFSDIYFLISVVPGGGNADTGEKIMKRKNFSMNNYIIVLCLILCLSMMAQSASALPFRSDLNRGNDLYKKGKYAEAGQVYDKILKVSQ